MLYWGVKMLYWGVKMLHVCRKNCVLGSKNVVSMT